MSHNLSFPTSGNLYQFPALNTGVLYINGKKFEDYINELVFEDQFEETEIQELKLLVQYLNTSGLSSEWIVDNNNKNQDLKTAITALQTKLANIDTTALTQSSVLTNDNRNSVLKTAIDTATSDLTALTTRVTTAEGDIDNVENKTKYITTSTTATIPGLSGVTPAYIKIRPFETDEPIRAIDLFVNPDEPTDRGYLVAPVGRQTYMRMIGTAEMTSLTQPQYNKIEMQTNRFSLEANDIKITCNPLDLSVTLGEISVPGTIRIGAKSDTIEIGTEPPNPLFENKINIGVVGFPTKSITSIKGFLNVAGCEWVLPKSDKFTIETLIAFIPTAGLPAWVLSFALGSSIPSFEYSDVFVMKDGATGVNKSGEVTTSNEPKVKSLVVFNRDLNIARLTPIEGTFVASGTISKTTLNGSIRNSVFLDGGGDNKICLKHHNIAATDITEWATTEGNDKCNVFEIGGNSGILLHQGAANAGTDIKIINSKAGNIVLKVGTGGGIKSDTKDSFTVLHDANYPGAAIGRLSPQAFDTNVTNRTNNPIARLEIDCVANRKGIRLFGYDPAQPFTLAPDETNLTNQLINTPAITTTTATATSLVINGNYTGNTDARLYKNADNKLMWNGAEVGAGGVSSGGITYMINVASNITNPNPTPTETIITAAYSGNAQRTITQAVTANTAYYIAKYTTEVFDEASNPVLTGLQQLNQYVVWNSQNQVGQLYGQLWFQATAIGFGVLYQRTYASPATTTPATFINGTPIPTPKGLYNIKFQRVVFPNINVVVTNGPVVLRYRVEGLVSGSWTSLYSMVGLAPEVLTTTNNLTITLDESVILNQTTPGATAVRLVLFIGSGTGTISQTSAGGADLAAYSLIGLGANTPALFRTMLYDGTNAKITIPYSTTPTLVEYDLAIDAPYNVSAFASPTLSTDLYFIQPSGGFVNHAITLYFNEGSISHYHSTISPTQTTPTLAQVLNSGATASQPINMNTNKISGITALEGSSNGNWNVKEITAGTNISVSSTTGTYQINNNAPVQEVSAGTGIQIAKNGSTAQVINNAAVQNLTAGSGILIQVDTATRIATISNTATAGGQTARDQLSATSSVGLVPNKLSHYAQNWTTQSVSVQPGDIFVSHDGRNCVYIPGTGSGNSFVQYSFDYGVTWTNSNLQTAGFLYICGSLTGEVLYISRFGATTGSAPNVVYSSNIYVSYNYGVFWSELTLDRTPGAANTWYNRFIRHIRCSSDGSVVIASTFRTTSVSGVANDGTLYISTNGGSTWVVRNITAGPAQVGDCCMSANGAIMFATMNGVLGGATDNGNGGIYRSFDFGATWTRVRNQIAAGSYYFGVIKCDATGRFLVAGDESQTDPPGGQIQTSDDYGSGWTWFGDEQARAATAAYVSPGGNLMITAHDPAFSSRIRYSTDYGRNWINAISLNTILGTSTIRTLASNNDGSVLLIRSDNAAAIYRCVEERGKLELAATSRDLTLTPAFGGGYTLLSNPTETLWFSGGFEIQTGNPQSKVDFDFLSSGKIDLTQFDIRYEIDCYWSTGTNAYIYPLLAINDVRNIDLGAFDNGLSYDQLSGLTNWTNNINNGVYGGSEVYTQTYRNRFFAGYFPPSTTNSSAPTNDLIRQRSLIKGTLSLHRRPVGQTGIVDAAQNARDILNIFTCDNYATRFYSGMNYLLNSSVQQGIDYGVNHQRINGTAIFPAEPVFSYNAMGAGTHMANGIFRLGFHLSEGGNTSSLRPRAAHYTYRIYRVRK